MTLVNAIQVLFAQAAPTGADFEGAFNALKGKKDTDLSQDDVTMLDELAETFQDFVGDPASWLKKASSTDSRHCWWVRIAQTLGANPPAGGGTPATLSELPPESGPPVDDIESEQGIDPDLLASGALPPGRPKDDRGTEGGGVTIAAVDRDDEARERQRRLADEVARYESRGLADLRLAAEKRRLDEEAEERREARKRVREEERERNLSDRIPTRDIPLVTRRIIASDPYQRYCDRIRSAYARIRNPDPNVSQAGRTDLGKILRLCKKMEKGTEYLGSMSAAHLLCMASALERNRDLTEPAWFQANYVTGTYD